MQASLTIHYSLFTKKRPCQPTEAFLILHAFGNVDSEHCEDICKNILYTEAKADSTVTVTFTQTDDEHWVYMKRSDEVEGWIYFENKDTIVSGGKKYNRRDVFRD